MLKLKTLKSKCESNLSIALNKFIEDGWKVAKNHYTRVIKGQKILLY